ncbi:MAG: hypothetical protein HIU82_16010 [Proteobacteria bacterium]|nr:hypothetical protein [Pseudomonadota bacterium]
MPALLSVHLFGGMRAVDAAARPVLPRARKTRALLAVLAMHAPRPVLRTELIALLWSRREPEQARGSLRQALHELQTELGPLAASLLHADRRDLALSERGLWTDVATLSRAGAPQAVVLALHRPLLLADLAGVDPALDVWIAGEARRLARVAHGLARAALDPAMPVEATIAAAEHLVAQDPTDAAAWAALIAALARSGDAAAAVAAERRRRDALAPRAPGATGPAVPAGAAPPARGADSAPAGAFLAASAALARARAALPTTGLATTGLAATGLATTDPAARQAGRFSEAPAAFAPTDDVPADLLPADPAPGADEGTPPGAGEPAPSSAACSPTRATWIGAATARGLRIGVIGLRTLAGAGEATALAAGLSEELVAALARFRGISCIPLGLVGGAMGGEAARWDRADLDFLLDGMIQASGELVRVNMRLLDFAAGGEVVWSTRFDRPLQNLFALQDEIAGETVARLESRLLLWEERRGRAAADPTARRLLRAALPGLLRLDRAAFAHAGVLLDSSRRLDPGNASVHAWLAHWHLFAVGQGWAEDPTGAAQQVRSLADAAVALDPEDARGLALAAHVRGFVDRDAAAAEPMHARVADANPNLPLGWALSGLNEAYLGRHDEAIRRAGMARKLSPQDPLRYFFDMALAVPHLLSGDDAAAVRVGHAAIAANPGFSSAYKTQLAALGNLGRREEAGAIRARLLELEPGFSVGQALERSPIQSADGRARYAEGLRRGGLD